MQSFSSSPYGLARIILLAQALVSSASAGKHWKPTGYSCVGETVTLTETFSTIVTFTGTTTVVLGPTGEGYRKRGYYQGYPSENTTSCAPPYTPPPYTPPPYTPPPYTPPPYYPTSFNTTCPTVTSTISTTTTATVSLLITETQLIGTPIKTPPSFSTFISVLPTNPPPPLESQSQLYPVPPAGTSAAAPPPPLESQSQLGGSPPASAPPAFNPNPSSPPSPPPPPPSETPPPAPLPQVTPTSGPAEVPAPPPATSPPVPGPEASSAAVVPAPSAATSVPAPGPGPSTSGEESPSPTESAPEQSTGGVERLRVEKSSVIVGLLGLAVAWL